MTLGIRFVSPSEALHWGVLGREASEHPCPLVVLASSGAGCQCKRLCVCHEACVSGTQGGWWGLHHQPFICDRVCCHESRCSVLHHQGRHFGASTRVNVVRLHVSLTRVYVCIASCLAAINSVLRVGLGASWCESKLVGASLVFSCLFVLLLCLGGVDSHTPPCCVVVVSLLCVVLLFCRVHHQCVPWTHPHCRDHRARGSGREVGRGACEGSVCVAPHPETPGEVQRGGKRRRVSGAWRRELNGWVRCC